MMNTGYGAGAKSGKKDMDEGRVRERERGMGRGGRAVVAQTAPELPPIHIHEGDHGFAEGDISERERREKNTRGGRRGQCEIRKYGSEGAWGLSRAELDDLTVRRTQAVSMHDVQLRETRACLLRRVVMPATGKCGKKFVGVDTKWKHERADKQEEKGGMGSKHLRLAVALLEEAHGDYMASAEAKQKIEEGF